MASSLLVVLLLCLAVALCAAARPHVVFGGRKLARVQARAATPQLSLGVSQHLLQLRGGGAGAVKKPETLEEVEEEVASAGDDKLVVMYFTATWCGPCQAISPVLEEVALEMGSKAVFLKIDVDKNAEAAAQYDVFQMPTFIFLKGGEVLYQFSGARPDVLREKVVELSGVEPEQDTDEL